jgi:hypothetical protein
MGLFGGILSITKIIILFLLLFVLINPASATWWNDSWNYRVDNSITNGSRSYQISLNISNTTGMNNATHIFCNGNCNSNFTDIRFTLDNITVLPYWIENNTTGKVWVNVTVNGTVNMYYGNTDALSKSSLLNTSATTEYGANPTANLDTGSTNSYANSFTATSNMKVVSMSINTSSGVGKSVRLGLYSDTGSNIPNTLLASSVLTGFTIGWVELFLQAKVNLTNGTKYWNALYSQSGAYFYYKAGTSSYTNSLFPTSWSQTGTIPSEFNYKLTYFKWVAIEPAWSTWGAQQPQPFSFCSNPTSSSTTTNSVILTCDLVNGTGVTWFQYGGASGAYKFRSDYQIVSGDFSTTISGLPLQAGGTYYYQGLLLSNGVTYISSQGSFTLPKVGQITDYDFDKHTEELAYNGLNISATAIVIPAAYTDIVGSIFWGIVFGFIFVMIWLRQEDITIPALVGLLIGASLWALMPPEWVSLAYSLTIVSFGGLMYSLIKNKS